MNTMIECKFLTPEQVSALMRTLLDTEEYNSQDYMVSLYVYCNPTH